jgi:hypothetical protein
MKKFEDLLNKRNSELEAEKRARDARIKDLNSKKSITTLKLVGSIIGALIGYNLGIVHWDGGLFTGFFMQILFIAGGIASVVFLIQLLILLAKNVDE